MTQSTTKAAWARGGTVFAATIMLVIGIYQIFEGIAAIANNNFFVVGPEYTYSIDTTAWGWIHLGIGVLVAATGFFVFTGATWARMVGIALAVISATANFFFLPYYPLWALLIIGLNIFAIWALATVPRGAAMGDAMDTSMAGSGAMRGDYPQGDERWASTNTTAGRHWAPEPAKDTGTRTGTGATMENADDMAHQAAGRAGMGNQQPGMGQPGSGGQQPPQNR